MAVENTQEISETTESTKTTNITNSVSVQSDETQSSNMIGSNETLIVSESNVAKVAEVVNGHTALDAVIPNGEANLESSELGRVRYSKEKVE